MNRFLFLFAAAVMSVSLYAAPTTNKVVFVDENNQVNAPEVVASAADMATNKTQIAIAKASAEAAENASAEATKLIDATIQKIVEDELVIYCNGFTDSLGVLVSLPKGTKVRVGKFTPNVASDGEGNSQHEIQYYTTADAGAVEPLIRYSNSLEDGTNGFHILERELDYGSIDGSFVDENETEYNYGYYVRFWLPADGAGFFKVFLDADAAQGDGMTFDVTGGITGGITESVTVGNDTLVFRGGLLMEVKRNETE